MLQLKNMDGQQPAVEYIKSRFARGFSEKRIRAVLLRRGMNKEEIDAAFGLIESGPVVSPVSEAKINSVQSPAETGVSAGEESGVTLAAAKKTIYKKMSHGKNLFWWHYAVFLVVVLSGWYLYHAVSGFSREKVSVAAVASNTSPPEPPRAVIPVDFKIKFPEKWVVDDTGRFGALRQFINPQKDEDIGFFFNANINVISELTSLSLEEYVKASQEALPKFAENYEAVDDKKVLLAHKLKAHFIGGTYFKNGKQFRNLQLFIINNEKVYIATGTTLNSAWPTYKTIIKDSLLSFEL